jgi:superoxide dismutase, Cu-Zn family
MCTNAIAIFDNIDVKGSIKFHQCEKEYKTIVTFDLYGMHPNKMRACHIHEYGDESQGCKSLGSHWNPYGNNHSYTCLSIGKNKPNKCSPYRSHAGDLLNNITVNRQGSFSYSYTDSRLQIRGDISQSIIGRSIVIHDGIDDLGLGGNPESLKTGNAGGRMACAIIGHSKLLSN